MDAGDAEEDMMRLPFGFLSLKRALWDVYLSVRVAGVLHGVGVQFRRLFMCLVTRNNKPIPTYIMDKEWDYLIVLDACRWDIFCDVVQEPVPYIYSAGTWTGEWVRENFMRKNADLSDILVVTASPFMTDRYFEQNNRDYPFRACVNQFVEGWDDNIDTVRPRTFADKASQAVREIPHKRAIIHFIQPHVPWIRFVERNPHIMKRYNSMGKVRTWGLLWAMADKKEIRRREALDAYKGNIRLVLGAVEHLVRNLRGKVIITSDHGNLFGEYGLFGHPAGVYVPELLKVPWLELEGGKWLDK